LYFLSTVVLVVFERDGRVVEYFKLRRTPADLPHGTDAGRKRIPRAAARFVVGDNGAVSLGSN